MTEFTSAAKVAAKKSTKPKAKAPAKAKAQESQDVIADTAAFVENLTKDSAFDLVKHMDDETAFSQFKLGGALSVIQSHAWYEEEGYENFRNFVEVEFGIKYRKAMYLVSIYNNLVESGVPYDKVAVLGWSKLKEISGIITEENVDEWVESAKSMTVLQLKEYIKEKTKGSLEGSDSVGGEESTSKKVSTMTFKFHEDQREVVDEALDKAKHETNSEFSAVAMEAICMVYLNSDKAAKSSGKPMPDQMKDAGWQAVLEEFEKLWPEINLTVEA